MLNKIGLDFSKNNPDIMEIDIPEDKKSIGIGEIKSGIKWVSQKPFSAKTKALVIYNGQTITADGQNSLLKVLEEPPEYASIIILAKNETSILPTVQSRCQKIYAGKGNRDISPDAPSKALTGTTYQSLVKLSPARVFKTLQEIAKEDRSVICEILEEWIGQGRTALEEDIEEGKTHAVRHSENIKTMAKIATDLEKTNLNMKLALEYLALMLITRR